MLYPPRGRGDRDLLKCVYVNVCAVPNLIPGIQRLGSVGSTRAMPHAGNSAQHQRAFGSIRSSRKPTKLLACLGTTSAVSRGLHKRGCHHSSWILGRDYTGEGQCCRLIELVIRDDRRSNSFWAVECMCIHGRAVPGLSLLSRSFFQGLCVLGYCVAPLNIAALVSTFVHLIYVRAPVALAAWAWCVWGNMLFPGLSAGRRLTYRFVHSVCQLPRWYEDRASTHIARCLPSSVSPRSSG